jgi:ClpP class serine protease
MEQKNFWAMLPNSAKELLSNPHYISRLTPTVQLQPESVAQIEGVAVLDIQGVITSFPSWFGTDTNFLKQQIHIALSDKSIHTILLNFDSPGSNAVGMTEFADWLYQASQIKPIISFCTQAASGAFLLAAATNEIYASESSLLGSIGVIYTEYQDNNVVLLPSSNAPLKNLSIIDERGKQAVLNFINDLEQIFIGRLSQYRNIKTQFIIDNWGSGSVLTGNQALEVKMLDKIISFEQLIRQLTMDGQKTDTSSLIADALKQQQAAFEANLKQTTDTLLEKITATEQRMIDMQTKHQSELAALEAKQAAKIEAEQTRKQGIDNLFAVVANETQYSAQYHKLKSECLSDQAVDVEAARLKILALQATFNHAQPATINPFSNTQTDFISAATQYAQKNQVPFGKAVGVIARTQPELHQQYLQSVNAGAIIEWRNQ